VSITQGFSSKKLAESDGSMLNQTFEELMPILPELFKIVKRN
jgi:hypothetical protein